jgi:hypothetical protein
MAFKGYNAKIGIEIDLIKGAWINDILWTYVDSAVPPVAFDFSAAISFKLVIWNKGQRAKGRTILLTMTDSAELSESGGVITMDTAFPAEMTFGKYGFEMSYDEAVEVDKFIGVGTFRVI